MDGGPIAYPQILAGQQTGANEIVVDSDDVYWLDVATTPWTGAILRVPKAGGCVQTLAAGLHDPGGISVEGGWLYWAEDLDGTIMRISVDGKTRQVVAAGQTGPGPTYLFNGVVYWSDNGPANSTNDHLNGSIVAVAEDGGVPAVLVSGVRNPGFLAVDDTGLYWTSWGGYPIPDACCPGGLFKAPLAGGPPTTLAITNISGTLILTRDSVYWESDLGVCRVNKQGGPYSVVVPPPVEDFALDATRLFWDWQGDPNQLFDDAWIGEEDLDGGPMRYVANPVTFPSNVAVDDSFVYWTEWGDHADGFVMRAPK